MIDEKKLIEAFGENGLYLPEAVEKLINAQPKIGEWITCDLETLPDKEVLCCNTDGEIIFGYVFEDKTSGTGFSAENDNEFMLECVKWMEKPKA